MKLLAMRMRGEIKCLVGCGGGGEERRRDRAKDREMRLGFGREYWVSPFACLPPGPNLYKLAYRGIPSCFNQKSGA